MLLTAAWVVCYAGAMTDQELNEAVAVKVMGWRRVERDSTVLGSVAYQKPGESFARWPTSLPSFATDISAAMEVVEKMRMGELEWSLNSANGRWSAELWRGQMVEIASGIHESLPRAICLAALAAVET